MRKLPIFLFLATAAAPALAVMQDSGIADQKSDELRDAPPIQSEAAEPSFRVERSEPPARVERVRRLDPPIQIERVERRAPMRDDAGLAEQNDERIQRIQRIQRLREQRVVREDVDPVAGEVDTVSNWRRRERRVRTLPEIQPPVGAPEVTQPDDQRRGGLETHRRREVRVGDGHRRWSHDWRGDRRYDWRRWRERNRSAFRLGFYYDPFGWNYRRFHIGYNFWPSHYSSRYWLNDPWQYRLPRAYGPYRWVRYWNDALLVNIHTGQVVDVVHNFFW